ncbi:hypothetical protein [Lentibacillus amyloliquefaciens]|uniref:Uncharacterized protein n=1 Tax=Lentibacillus amyloliquefaciens TaxID=1472767 RepID=A0A0U3WKQ7_9BACI|nr:hypothetical protein [Lentibacillus amyloliquefaciens]ALX50463.1 hypothetical protein AOX59_18880 [Lentibacillus amyloliquefaciens]
MGNKVLKPFQDKTNFYKLYEKGDTYKHNDADRVASLVQKGFLQETKNPPKKNKKVDKDE